MGGSNAPLNPSAHPGQVPQQQHQQSLNMGPFIPNAPYQQPNVGTGNVLPITSLQGGINYQLGWPQPRGTYALGGPQNFGSVPFSRGFNPSQQGGYAMPYINQPQIGRYAQFPNQMGQNPQQGMYPYVNNLLMGVKIPRNKGGHCPFRKSQLDS